MQKSVEPKPRFLTLLSRDSLPWPVIDLEAIRAELPEVSPSPHPTSGDDTPATSSGSPLKEIERIAKDVIACTLIASKGNVGEAAKSLGLGRATDYRKIKKYNNTIGA